MKSDIELFEELLKIKNPEQKGDDDLINIIADLTDLSLDLVRLEGLDKAENITEILEKRNLTSVQRCLIHYFRSNIHANRWHLEHQSQQQNIWSWENFHFEQQIKSLRTARLEAGFKELPKVRQAQILTNLGNLLDQVGRFVEAIPYWEEAYEYGMAVGNRGFGLFHYAKALYDSGHTCVFLLEARKGLLEALKQPLELGAPDSFQNQLELVENAIKYFQVDLDYQLEEYELGQSDTERNYRSWALKNRLFLNPLNDLGNCTAAAQDILTNPPITVGRDDGPKHLGFYNQLKQEFVSARFLFFEGVHDSKPHFADRDVCLYNTFDYPNYSIHVEKIKAAFRMAHSIFDKIAFYLNDYLLLAIPERRVNFRTLWYFQQDQKKGLCPEFETRTNWALRGLFWLSKDLFEPSADLMNLIEPEGRALVELRNHLEHKYLKVHDDVWLLQKAEWSKNNPGLADSLAYSIGRKELEAKTLKLLQLVRAALIYLSLAIHREELERSAARQSAVFKLPVSLIEDDWKV
jgi:LA2681-like HEPN